MHYLLAILPLHYTTFILYLKIEFLLLVPDHDRIIEYILLLLSIHLFSGNISLCNSFNKLLHFVTVLSLFSVYTMYFLEFPSICIT